MKHDHTHVLKSIPSVRVPLRNDLWKVSATYVAKKHKTAVMRSNGSNICKTKVRLRMFFNRTSAGHINPQIREAKINHAKRKQKTMKLPPIYFEEFLRKLGLRNEYKKPKQQTPYSMWQMRKE